jgi:hypothetical protein
VSPDGTSLGNNEEIIYFKDSFYRNAMFPFLLKYLLRNELLQNSENPENKNLLLGGKLKLAKFKDTRHFGEQNVYQEDCKRIAVLYAFMFIC